MAVWKLIRIGADYNEIGKTLGIDPVVARIMKNRGLETIDDMRGFLLGDKGTLLSGSAMKDMDKAVMLVSNACKNKLKIRVIGDYDIDGICATAILVKGLRQAGADVDYAIPHRVLDGYGLNEHLIEDAFKCNVQMIITCDNGISAADSIALARDYGMQVVVTDHHEVPHDELSKEILPPANAVVNPKQKECGYPFKGICGAYVAYQLIDCFYMMGEFGEFVNKTELLELAAFATVGDVMELVGENRTLVAKGLRTMRCASNTGLRTLIDLTSKNEGDVTAYQVGFVYGPCINATGRLDTAERALNLLLTDSTDEATMLAEELKALNEERKELTIQGVFEATKYAEQQITDGNKVLVLYLPQCHESIAGIIAGRIREKFYRPTLVITDSADGGLKGSARSVEGYSMYEKLNECSELLSKFGGHPMAAGFSLPKENLIDLTIQLNQRCELTQEELTQVVRIDVDLPFSYVTERLLEDLSTLEPFGNKNPRPVFAQSCVTFLSESVFGKNKNFASYRIRDRHLNTYSLKFFGDLEHFHDFLDCNYGEGTAEGLKIGTEVTLNVIYNPSINTFGGRREVQFIMQDYAVYNRT